MSTSDTETVKRGYVYIKNGDDISVFKVTIHHDDNWSDSFHMLFFPNGDYINMMANEGEVYNRRVWFYLKNDSKARSAFIKDEKEEISYLQHTIETHKANIAKIKTVTIMPGKW